MSAKHAKQSTACAHTGKAHEVGIMALGLQSLHEPRSLRRLAAAIHALEQDKRAA